MNRIVLLVLGLLAAPASPGLILWPITPIDKGAEMKRRVLLVALPVLGLLLGLGLYLLFRLLNPPNPGVVVVIGDSVDGSAYFFDALQKRLEESPDVRVVDGTLIKELPKEERRTRPQKLEIARHYGAKLLVVGSVAATSEKRANGDPYDVGSVAILEVDTGVVLWKKELTTNDQDPLYQVVQEIKKRSR